MAEQHGGYRAPQHPAAVSGPGALSARTDGGPADPHQATRSLPDAHYGEQRDFAAAQQGAPMAAQPDPSQSIVPLDAPTQRPGEPVTHGADAGPGIGAASAGIHPSLAQADYANLRNLLPGLEAIASMPDSNPSTRAFVRQLRALGVGQ